MAPAIRFHLKGLNQWQSQNFSLEGAKLKEYIKSEINLKNIN